MEKITIKPHHFMDIIKLYGLVLKDLFLIKKEVMIFIE